MEKKTYIAPQLVLIKLDNEISLALQSAAVPPQGPGETELIDEYNSENKSVWE